MEYIDPNPNEDYIIGQFLNMKSVRYMINHLRKI